MKRYHYETNCVCGTAEKIHALTERLKPVTLATLRRHCRYFISTRIRKKRVALFVAPHSGSLKDALPCTL